tara:strand:- start:427 stop:696 length:270 start_codon:yes stop_codon:yes gene_type:complete
MNRLSPLKKFSTLKKTWCYRQGFYQIPKYKINENKINENKGISYHQWLAGLRTFATTETEKSINRGDGGDEGNGGDGGNEWEKSTINMK